MAKVSNTDVGNLSSYEQLQRFSANLFREIRTVVNNGITFTDNFNAKVVSVSFATANEEVRIEHNLGRIPTGYLLLQTSAATTLYDGVSPNTVDYVFIRASGVADTTVMVF